MSCSNNIRQIELAFHNHHSAHKYFPSNVRPTALSTVRVRWLTHLLPYVEQTSLYQQIDLIQNWSSIVTNSNGTKNLELFSNKVPIFECPSSPTAGQQLDGVAPPDLRRFDLSRSKSNQRNQWRDPGNLSPSLGNRPIKTYQRTHSSSKNASDTMDLSSVLSVVSNRGF